METKSHIANALEVADEKARYDDCAKKILSNKVILAHIMKDTMAEFKDVPLDTTMQCIEGTPDVGIVPLYPGKEKPEAITGLPTEDIVPNEGEVRYDIRFYAVTPDSHEKIFIDVEIQNSFNVDYDFSARGIFYGARMLSSQLDTEFTTDHYNGIKKVYSIWIVTDAPLDVANQIAEYSISKKDVHGHFDRKMKYDLLSVVLVFLDMKHKRKTKNQGTKLHGLLNTLFTAELTPDEKETILEEEYDIRRTLDRKELLTNMCNLSQGIENKGIQKGIQQGVQQGAYRANYESAKQLMLSGVSLEIIKPAMPNLSDADFAAIQKEIAQNN